jgi:hypothetical protein
VDTEAFIRRPELGARVVGMKLDDLVYAPHVNQRRMDPPPPGSLHRAEDITAPFRFGDEV